jgi:flagellar biosynthesis/type III secretory pathway protein FliH
MRARSWWAEERTTLSLKATGRASVRGAATGIDVIGAWTLADLAVQAPVSAAAHEEAAMPPEEVAAIAELRAKERAALIDEGYARGLADGEKKANATAQTRIDSAVALIDEVVSQMRDLASLAPAILEENIAALSIIVARQIVARAVAVEKDAVADLVRRALTEFPIEQAVRIRVNPLDLSLLTMHEANGESAPITGSREASWVADPRITRGGCLLEGRDRIIDGRVDTALERAYQRMAQVDAA